MTTGAFFPDPNKRWREMMKKMEFPDPGKRLREILEGIEPNKTALKQLKSFSSNADWTKRISPPNPTTVLAEGILSKIESQSLATQISEEWLRQPIGSESLVRLATDLQSNIISRQLTVSLVNQIADRLNVFRQSPDLASSVLAQLQQPNLAARVLSQAGAFTLAQNTAIQLSTEGIMDGFRSQIGVASLLSAHISNFNALSTKAAEHYASRRVAVEDDQALIDEVFNTLVSENDSEAIAELEKITAPITISERLMVEGAEFWGLSAVPKTDAGRIILGVLVGYLVGLVYILGVTTGEDMTLPEMTRTVYETVGYASGSSATVFSALKWGPSARKKLDEMNQKTIKTEESGEA